MASKEQEMNMTAAQQSKNAGDKSNSMLSVVSLSKDDAPCSLPIAVSLDEEDPSAAAHEIVVEQRHHQPLQKSKQVPNRDEASVPLQALRLENVTTETTTIDDPPRADFQSPSSRSGSRSRRVSSNTSRPLQCGRWPQRRSKPIHVSPRGPHEAHAGRIRPRRPLLHLPPPIVRATVPGSCVPVVSPTSTSTPEGDNDEPKAPRPRKTRATKTTVQAPMPFLTPSHSANTVVNTNTSTKDTNASLSSVNVGQAAILVHDGETPTTDHLQRVNVQIVVHWWESESRSVIKGSCSWW
jgi:hypothetical protein